MWTKLQNSTRSTSSHCFSKPRSYQLEITSPKSQPCHSAPGQTAFEPGATATSVSPCSQRRKDDCSQCFSRNGKDHGKRDAWFFFQDKQVLASSPINALIIDLLKKTAISILNLVYEQHAHKSISLPLRSSEQKDRSPSADHCLTYGPNPRIDRPAARWPY